MAYQTYTTDALVIGNNDRLTADKVFSLFTREAGLVHARAISVRKECSKLRYGLQDFSLVRTSLVRGKSGWRITGAEHARNLYFSACDRHARGALLRVLRLVRRLVRGEETHVALFDLLIEGLAVFAVCKEEEIVRAERMLTLRILSALGYVAPKDAYAHLLTASSLSAALSDRAESVSEERATRVAIDEALAVSQL